MADTISIMASLCGLPVSACTTSASWPARRVIMPFQRFSRSARPTKPRPAHHSAASRAASTAAVTSTAVLIGYVPTTSSVAGSRESNVVACSVPGLVCTLVMRATLLLSSQSGDSLTTVTNSLQIIHFGHSCVLVETGSARLLFDPGTFSHGFEDLRDLDAILITHQHADHLDIDRLPALIQANPQATLVADPGSAEQEIAK